MKKLSTNEIRKMWLDYFASKGHHVEESKSLIPVNDDSLLFINSGVATLKKYFDGSEKPPKNRITNAQKSIRTNDIENVGVTSRHHTLFEMLGNFSIGDYFKQEAIDMMFEILFDPQWFDFDINDFYFTIHPNDSEAYELLKKHNVSDERIVKLEDNFWEIGNGPGGPNLEIFFDRGEKYDSRDPRELLLKDIENDRVIEVWNIVFSQYNCKPGELSRNEYEELPQKNIDTGMGLERMACIMQEVETNFETDNFMVIIKVVESMSGKKYENNKLPFRVISDHIRALTFAIADGVVPSNDGRGYVLRRILRRASKYGFIDLDLKEPFLYKLVDIVVDVSQPFYDYLINEKEYVKKIIYNEEVKFLKTLSIGMDMLSKEINKLSNNILPGAVAFKMYDTFGFPIELTTEIANENDITVDLDSFNDLLEQQRQRARNGMKDNEAMHLQNSFLKNINLPSEFIGYDKQSIKTKVLMITDLENVYQTISDQHCYVMLEQTPFYAESGGQVSDGGTIAGNDVLEVLKLPNGQHLMKVEVVKPFNVGDEVIASVDLDKRYSIARNHSATHLLHFAIRKVLGDDAKQAGSYQDEKRTRFDFSYLNKISSEELKEIEEIVNQQIRLNNDVIIEDMPIKEAQEIGAMSLFSDKYGDVVRVVKIGDSIELCGGTHVHNSGEIGACVILSESGIGSGVRRIEAITGNNIAQYLLDLECEYKNAVQNMKEKLEDETKEIKSDSLKLIVGKIKHVCIVIDLDTDELDQHYDNVCQQIEKHNITVMKNATLKNNDIVEQAKDNVKKQDGISYIYEIVHGVDTKTMKSMIDNIVNSVKVDVVILISNYNGKTNVVVRVDEKLTNQLNANEILQLIIKPHNGRGGGKPTLAQGGY